MGLSESEKNKLQAFTNITLSKNQTEVIIGRTLTNSEWKSLNIDYRRLFAQTAKQTANIAKHRRHNFSKTYLPTSNELEVVARNKEYIRKKRSK